MDLGLSLVISLKFLLAADIAVTSISPSWNGLGSQLQVLNYCC
ncbi:MAG: DUF1622 domain-containing protein [Xenococcaceae cyanobacterium MO_167.B52]|nr:DUF1622 domain-containing protein [Xenococcaceae cyanobacterium MO_167.B52]